LAAWSVVLMKIGIVARFDAAWRLFDIVKRKRTQESGIAGPPA
jgi:hypothetical protein